MPFDDAGNRRRIAELRSRGVDVWGPERVYVGEDVNLRAIAPGSEIRQATLTGPALRIAQGAIIGTSGHAEVRDCQVGRDTELGSGLYLGATFLDGVKIRGFAEIRAGTLLEEQVDLAHCVALKNSIFTSCCVAGSLINFCDLMLSGGSSRQDHTEIGSGAVHYNFDPRGDKWGSLIGSIRGVLLRSDPVFIGGACGLVGPLIVGLGAVTAAGSTIRKDVGENHLVADASGRLVRRGFNRSSYGPLRRPFLNTARLVGTLHALKTWYRTVRLPHASARERPFYEAGIRQIAHQIEERIWRLGRVVEKLSRQPDSDSRPVWLRNQHSALIAAWSPLRNALQRPAEPGALPEAFLSAYAAARAAGAGHVDALKTKSHLAEEAEAWVEGLVDRFMDTTQSVLPPE